MGSMIIFSVVAYFIEAIVLYLSAKMFLNSRFRLHTYLEAILILCSIWFTNFLKLRIHLALPDGMLFELAKVMINIGLHLIIVCIFFRDRFVRKLVLVVSFYGAMFICDCLAALLLILFKQPLSPISEIEELPEYVSVLSRFLLPVFLFLLNRSKFAVNKPYLFKHSVFIVGALFICVNLVAFFPFGPQDNLFYQNQKFLFFVSFCVALIAVGLLIILSYTMQTKKRLKLQLKSLTDMQVIQHLYNRVLYEENTNYQVALHDVRNLVDYFLDLEKDNNVLKTLSKNIGTVTKWTGNQDVDTFLCYQYNKMQASLIEFSVDGLLPKTITWLHTIDMLVLICNALDNAIEAVEKLEKNRFISMKFIYRENDLFIDIDNPYDEKPTYIDGHIKTSKNKPGHGYGLKNIEMVAQDYHGYVNVNAEKGIFKLSVFLQRPNEDK